MVPTKRPACKRGLSDTPYNVQVEEILMKIFPCHTSRVKTVRSGKFWFLSQRIIMKGDRQVEQIMRIFISSPCACIKTGNPKLNNPPRPIDIGF
jgi:hypothetical protein